MSAVAGQFWINCALRRLRTAGKPTAAMRITIALTQRMRTACRLCIRAQVQYGKRMMRYAALHRPVAPVYRREERDQRQLNRIHPNV